MEENAKPSSNSEEAGKTNSQFTYNLRPNGDWENRYDYTDGPSDYNRGNIGRAAQHGDIQHSEYVWRNNAWVQTNIQYY